MDIVGQLTTPSGHGINPVPVTENKRIPDINEIIDAQLAGDRLISAGREMVSLFAMEEVDQRAAVLLRGANQFVANLLGGFEAGGIDTGNPVEMFLSIRRIGGKMLEKWYGPGEWNEDTDRRKPWVISDITIELDKLTKENLRRLKDYNCDAIQDCGLKLVVNAMASA